MTPGIVLDIALIVALISYLVWGLREGLSRTGFTIAGVIAGAVAAFFLSPMIAAWVPYPALRPWSAALSAILLIVIGHLIGSTLGRAIGKLFRGPLAIPDRLLGGAATVIVAALVVTTVAGSVGRLGVPLVSQAIAGSAVLRTINQLTPDPVEAWLAEVRGTVADAGIPVISDALGGGIPDVPDISTGTPALDVAATSVVRITGNAYACGIAQAGTGFVVADDRIVTNAHVLAGVEEAVIEAPDGQVVTGRIVYFDPIDDIAVVYAPGLGAGPLPLGETATQGERAAILGYPFGGPFVSGGAEIIDVFTAPIDDIYGTSRNDREIYSLAAEVREGNSGGPVLSLDGRVMGVVFARNAANDSVGYAMTTGELRPVAEAAPAMESTVSTGECVQG